MLRLRVQRVLNSSKLDAGLRRVPAHGGILAWMDGCGTAVVASAASGFVQEGV